MRTSGILRMWEPRGLPVWYQYLLVQMPCDVVCSEAEEDVLRSGVDAALVLTPVERIVILVLEEVRALHEQTRNDSARNHAVVSPVVAVGLSLIHI